MKIALRRLGAFLLTGAAFAAAPGLSAQPLPDLVVQSIDRSQVVTGTMSLALSGNLLSTVKNIGGGAASGTVNVLAFYDSKRQGIYDPKKDPVLGIGRATLSLGTGQATAVTIGLSGNLPFRDAPISVVVDSHKEMRESNDKNNVKSSVGGGRVLQDVATAPPLLKWNWTGSQAFPGYNKVHAMTTVGPLDDTNGDGRYDAADEPRVVAVAWSSAYYTGGYLHVLSGKTGAELRVFPQLVQAGVAPTIADLDGDGVPEIITIDQGRRLVALNQDLSVKWMSTITLPSSTVNWGGVTVADIDGDGVPEIFWGNYVFNASGVLKWTADTSNFGGHCCYHGDFFSSPVVTRLSATGPQVLLLGAAAFSANGSKLWENAAVGDGVVSVGDLDKDGVPEIVLMSASGNKLYALRPDGSVKWGPVALRDALVPFSPPVIADLDGDGFPDVGLHDVRLSSDGAVGLDGFFSAFNRAGNLIWTREIDATGNPAGAATAFDFNANGTAHPMIVGYDRFNILSGVNGTTLAAVSAAGYFATHPVVVDADGDGVADIVFSSTSFSSLLPTGVLAFSNPAWAGTRKAWNQYTYSISNINDNMSVPRNPLASWQDSNTFRVNRPIAAGGGGGVDISASKLRLLKDKCRNDHDDDDDDCRCGDDDIRKGKPLRVSVRIGNAGSVDVPKKIPVAVYGETRTGVTWLGNGKTNEKMASGEYDDVKISVRSLAGVQKLIVVADDDGTGAGTLGEANRVNNRVELNPSR